MGVGGRALVTFLHLHFLPVALDSDLCQTEYLLMLYSIQKDHLALLSLLFPS